MFIIAQVLVVAIIGVCFFCAYSRTLGQDDNGARNGIKNDDVSVDTSCDDFLELTNLSYPASFKSPVE